MDSWRVYTQHGVERVTRVADFPDFDSALEYGQSISPDTDSSMVPNVDDSIGSHPGYEKGLFWFGNRYAVITHESLSAVTAANDHVAKPQPAPPGGPKFEVYAKPFVCAVCGKPIEHPHRGGGAWRHVKTAASQQDIGFNNSKFFYWGTTDIGLAQAKQSGEIRDGNDRFVIISTRFEDVSDSPVAVTMALPMVWLWDNIDPDVREMCPNQKEFFRIMALWSGELNVLAPIPTRYLKTMGKASAVDDFRCTNAVFKAIVGYSSPKLLRDGGALLEAIVAAGYGYEVMDIRGVTLRNLCQIDEYRRGVY